MTDLILVRGLPGSGKSTIASKMVADAPRDAWVSHRETDQFFELEDGTYKFDGSRLKEAHEWCQAKTREDLGLGYMVIVTNTFTQVWEMQAYLDMAKELGKTVKVMTATGEFGNLHGVPPDAVERMKARWEPYGE